jgi:hypothetical protein
MRKNEARVKVLDRFPSQYPKSVADVLVKIIDLIQVDDWRTSGIEGLYSPRKTYRALGFLVRSHAHTARRALNILLDGGFITESTETRNSFRVNTDQLLTLPSGYVTRRTAGLEEKIINTLRMQFTRNPEKTPRWRSTHPALKEDGTLSCKCEKYFCLHPSVL